MNRLPRSDGANTDGARTETARHGEIGQRLRALRRAKSITLQQVADGTGLSKSFVSQIEAGMANPTVASLKRIASVLGIPLAALFDGGPDEPARAISEPGPTVRDVRVVRRDKRKTISWPGRRGDTHLLSPDLQRRLEVLLSVDQPGEGSDDEDYSHEGEEFGFVLEGSYEVVVANELYTLEEGDSIYYPSGLPHRTRAIGSKPARTLWVITPPSF